MTRYIDADELLKEMDLYIERLQRMYKRRLRKGEVGVFLDLKAIAEGQETVEAVPIKWLYEQSDNPDRSNIFRNACDSVAMAWMAEAERIEE